MLNMHRKIIVSLFLMVMFITSNGRGMEKCCFDFSINNTSIYTPGKVILSFQLKEMCVLEGEYRYNIYIYDQDVMLKNQSVLLKQEESQQITLEFDDMKHVTLCRCRVELLLENEPLEVKELFLKLYPSSFKPLIQQQNSVVWAYDESGRLQAKLNELNVEFMNANYQLIRDFIEPDIILLGEDIHPANINLVISNYESRFRDSVWIYLKQKSLVSYQHIQLKPFSCFQRSIVCDYEGSMLDGLTSSDLMSLINKGEYFQVFDNNAILQNYIGINRGDEYVESLLVHIENSPQKIYCHIPLLEEGPVGDILLSNLINCGIAKSQSVKNK